MCEVMREVFGHKAKVDSAQGLHLDSVGIICVLVLPCTHHRVACIDILQPVYASVEACFRQLC